MNKEKDLHEKLYIESIIHQQDNKQNSSIVMTREEEIQKAASS